MLEKNQYTFDVDQKSLEVCFWMYPTKKDLNKFDVFIVITIQFATKKQLKDLTHMFCFQIPCRKLYKEGAFSYVLTLKYKCHFGMSSKKFNLKFLFF